MFTNKTNDKIEQYPILQKTIEALSLKNLSPRTVENYLCVIYRFLDFINYDNEFDITIEHFRSFLVYLNSTSLTKNTINCYNSHIRFFFNAVLFKPVNPYIVPKSVFKRKEISYLMDDQVKNLLKLTASDSRMDCIIKLGLCCGLRIDEVASLRVCDIHTKGSDKIIHIDNSKRNKSRDIPMDNTTYCAIQRYAKEYFIKPGTEAFFFQFRLHHKPTAQTIRNHFNEYRSRAGIDDSVTFHGLRHTYAVNFLKAGGDICDLKYRMGHGSLAATSRYLHFASNMMKPGVSYMDKLLKDVK
ncbi:MAG: tyrosine-type recombinase/integrase [Erysipelotrichaceae bacterium]|nr:tyrosine-type recombinase/integrase [Erysipelotrichaceae bacterium]